MSAVEVLLRQFRRSRPPFLSSVPFTGPIGATEIQAAPAAGQRLLVIGGGATVNTTSTVQWYHTAVAGGNELTNAMTVAAGTYQPAGPFFLPEAVSLWVNVTIGIFRGYVLLATL